MSSVDIPTEAFDEKVRALARRDGVDALLAIPGVWELVSESLNNDAIRELEQEAEETKAAVIHLLPTKPADGWDAVCGDSEGDANADILLVTCRACLSSGLVDRDIHARLIFSAGVSEGQRRLAIQALKDSFETEPEDDDDA